jgi:hypothetical protein
MRAPPMVVEANFHRTQDGSNKNSYYYNALKMTPQKTQPEG